MAQLIVGIIMLASAAVLTWFGGQFANEGWKQINPKGETSTATDNKTVVTAESATVADVSGDNNTVIQGDYVDNSTQVIMPEAEKQSRQNHEEENPAKTFELLEPAQEPINNIAVSLEIRGNHNTTDSDYGEKTGGSSYLSISLIGNSPIKFKPTQKYSLLKRGSGKQGRSLAINYELAEDSYIRGKPIAILGEAHQIELDVTKILRTLSLGLDDNEECYVYLNISVNGIHTVHTTGIFPQFSIILHGPGAITDDATLSNLPFAYTLQTEERIKGPSLSSYFISKSSQYTTLVKYFNSVATDKNRIDLTPNAISFFTFDHRSGSRMNMTKTNYPQVTELLKNYSATNVIPLSMFIAGASTMTIDSPVEFSVPLNKK